MVSKPIKPVKRWFKGPNLISWSRSSRSWTVIMMERFHVKSLMSRSSLLSSSRRSDLFSRNWQSLMTALTSKSSLTLPEDSMIVWTSTKRTSSWDLESLVKTKKTITTRNALSSQRSTLPSDHLQELRWSKGLRVLLTLEEQPLQARK